MRTYCQASSIVLPVRVWCACKKSKSYDDTTCPEGTGRVDPRLSHRCPIAGSVEKPAQEFNGKRESPSEPSDEQSNEGNKKENGGCSWSSKKRPTGRRADRKG
ncbi:hypothetical protein CsSME_00026893 [Camellia sinensis var. sinensis]